MRVSRFSRAASPARSLSARLVWLWRPAQRANIIEHVATASTFPGAEQLSPRHRFRAVFTDRRRGSWSRNPAKGYDAGGPAAHERVHDCAGNRFSVVFTGGSPAEGTSLIGVFGSTLTSCLS